MKIPTTAAEVDAINAQLSKKLLAVSAPFMNVKNETLTMILVGGMLGFAIQQGLENDIDLETIENAFQHIVSAIRQMTPTELEVFGDQQIRRYLAGIKSD